MRVERGTRDSNVIDAWFRLQKASRCRGPLVKTFRNTLNEGLLITLMNPRILSSYTWLPRWRARKPATSRPSSAFFSRYITHFNTPLPIVFIRHAETLIKVWRIKLGCLVILNHLKNWNYVFSLILMLCKLRIFYKVCEFQTIVDFHVPVTRFK